MDRAKFWTLLSDARSRGRAAQRQPAAVFSVRMRSMASSAAWRLRQARMTVQPCLAKDRAVSKPIPVLAPVTIASFPERSRPCKT